MQHIEICSSKSLVLRHYVTANGQKIFGTQEQGRAVLESSNPIMRIHFSAESIVDQVLPWHCVCDSLLHHLEIPEERHALLNSILHAHDFTLIEDMVERAGLLEGQLPLSLPRKAYRRGTIGSFDLLRRPTTS
jgi:hypothetical protein